MKRDRFLGPAFQLIRNLLLANAVTVTVGQNDGADHGDQKNDPRRLEQIDVLGIDQLAQRVGIGDVFRRGSRRGDGRGCFGGKLSAAQHHQQFGQQDERDDTADGQIA